jgi:hypothetical protein
MTREEILAVWNLEDVRRTLTQAFEANSETQLLTLIRNNSFLLYELYSRKHGIQPPFAEINFGTDYRCDFAWLNDNSDGPEWILVEVEPPKLELFTRNADPTQRLNHSIEQLRSWRRYFDRNPLEKRRIFGAVHKFRLILVVGDLQDWQQESALHWRADHNKNLDVEIRSSNVFWKALEHITDNPTDFWSFAEYPRCRSHRELSEFWQSYDYMNLWRRMLT